MIRELSFAYCEKSEYGDHKVLRDAIGMMYQCEEELKDDSDWNLFQGLAYYYMGEPKKALSHFDYCLGNKRIDEDYLEMIIVDCEQMCAGEEGLYETGTNIRLLIERAYLSIFVPYML